jgi:ribonucleoside-diphosphate reductase alpha chain
MIREQVLEYFKGDELATDVFLSKYSLNGKETPDEMHDRLAKEFARVLWREYGYIEHTSHPIKYLSKFGEYFFTNLWESNTLEDVVIYIKSLFKNFEYIVPQGSVMGGVGTGAPVSYSNCFVIQSPEDSIESIMNTARDMAQIYKRRGGVGLDISNLRPNGSSVNNAAKTSTGAVSFMSLFSHITEVVGQEGRRGALMLSMDINHPDSPDFATIKRDLSKVTGANISLKLNNAFIEAVKNDTDYLLRWPVDKVFDQEYPTTFEYNKLTLVKHADGTSTYVKRVKAKELWDTIVESNWLSAEPGIFNWDHLINYDPTGVYPQLKPISTNPCGELGLGAGDSCRLLATNLYSLVNHPFKEESFIDDDFAYQIFYQAQVLADVLVSLEIEAIDRILYKLNEDWLEQYYSNIDVKDFLNKQSDEFKLWWQTRDIAVKGRRTGTGITAYGDMMAALNLPYGSKEMTEKVFSIKLKAELDASIDMAILKGAFPFYNKNLEFNNFQETDTDPTEGRNDWYQFILKEYPEQASRMINFGRRNSGISTVAPTGSVSILTQTTSGIEPLFKPFYTRRKKCNPGEIADYVDQNGVGFREFTVLHPKFIDWYLTKNPENTKEHLETLNQKDLQVLFESSPWYGSTSEDIDIDTRIQTQTLIQKYITSSISSTVNVPAETTKETMSKGYLDAFDLKCKGLTYYREGSRSGILVSDTPKDKVFKSHDAPKRPKELEANLHITVSKGNTYAVVIGLFENKPYEVFVFNTLGEKLKECSGKIVKIKQGHYRFIGDKVTIDNLNESGNSELEKASALYTSMLLRHGADIHYVIKTAKKINDGITSFVSAMCRILSKYDTKIEESICPECGGKLVHEAGCATCKDCGYSRC